MRRLMVLFTTAALAVPTTAHAVGQGCAPAGCLPVDVPLDALATDVAEQLPRLEGLDPGGSLAVSLRGVLPTAPAVRRAAPVGSLSAAVRLLREAGRRAEAVRARAVPLSPAELADATELARSPYLARQVGEPLRVRPRLAELARRVDLRGIATAVATVAAAVDAVRTGLSPAADASACEGSPTAPTELADGQVAVDPDGVPTLYAKPYVITIDLGGCDVYRNTAGGASATTASPVGVAIDLGSDDDRYEQPEKSYGLGASSGGVGVLFDAGGNDVYRASGYASMGAGIVGGAGLLADGGGDDRYEYVGAGGGFGAQGNATIGVGALLDFGGSDRYLFEFDPGDTSFGSRLLGAQGAGTVAAIGVLADANGDDDYRAVTLGNTVSVDAQGVGNFLPGSTGVLLDGAGDDVYTVEAHVSKEGGVASGGASGQGVGILSGVGLLRDLGGDDTYRVATEARGSTAAFGDATGQGFGTAVLQYTGLGALLDEGGDDRYDLVAEAFSDDPARGSAAALGQGQGFLLANGLLVDVGGGDTYRQEARAPGGEALSSGQGAGLGAASGALIDRSGADRYIAGDLSQGYGSTWHFFEDIWLPGGTGVLLDGAGRNAFTGPGREGATWTQSVDGVGVGVDAGRAGLTGFDLVDGVLHLMGLERPHAVVSTSISSPAPGIEIHGDVRVSGAADGGGLAVDWVEWRIDSGPWSLADRAGSSWTAWSADVDADALPDGDHDVRVRAWAAAIDSAPAILRATYERWLPAWDVRRSGDELDLAFTLATRRGDPIDDGDVVLRVVDPADGAEIARFTGIGEGGGGYRASVRGAGRGPLLLRAEWNGQVLGETVVDL